MVTINIWALIILFGIPSGITSFSFYLIQRKINEKDKLAEEREKKREEKMEKREEARKKYELFTIKGTSAAIALGEATARAVQKIPDAHCNGDMHKALEYAEKIKHEQKDFLSEQGINALFN